MLEKEDRFESEEKKVWSNPVLISIDMSQETEMFTGPNSEGNGRPVS
ncbi:MAG: hypothetical protein AAF557_22670 [Pseudomonadota bacterium]